MRLDLFLWHARLAKTRSAAQALATTGRLRLDGRLVERAHVPVRIGSVLVFARGQEVRALRVEALPLRRGPFPEARACYSELTVGAAPTCKTAVVGGQGDENVSQQGPGD